MAGIRPTLPHHTRRVRVRAPLPHNTRTVRVGELYLTAGQVRAELDRVDSRWLALKRDIVHNIPLGDATPENRAEFRRSFLDAFYRWRRFYEDAADDWMGWGTNVTQAESFDAELDNWRTRYASLTGREPSAPTTSATGRRYRASGDAWADAIKWVAGGAAVVAIAYAVTR